MTVATEATKKNVVPSIEQKKQFIKEYLTIPLYNEIILHYRGRDKHYHWLVMLVDYGKQYRYARSLDDVMFFLCENAHYYLDEVYNGCRYLKYTRMKRYKYRFMVQVLTKVVSNRMTDFPGASSEKLDISVQKKGKHIYLNFEGNRYVCKNWKDAYHKLILAAIKKKEKEEAMLSLTQSLTLVGHINSSDLHVDLRDWDVSKDDVIGALKEVADEGLHYVHTRDESTETIEAWDSKSSWYIVLGRQDKRKSST